MTNSTGAPYRTADVAVSLDEPGVLVLHAQTMWSAKQRSLLQVFAVVGALVVPVWMEWTRLAPFTFVLSVAAVLVRRRSNQLRIGRVVLDARHGRVVMRGGGRVRPSFVPIDAIQAVTLQHSTVKAFSIEGGLRAGRLSTTSLRARIVIRTADHYVPLTRHDLAQAECLEWLSMTRRFLCAHGWKPMQRE